MGTHIEVQHKDEVMQIRSRELQLENTKKLNNIIPVVEEINNVNLSQIESNTSEIKDIVSQNLEEQTNLDDINDTVNKLNKNVSTIKGQFTKLSKKVDELLDVLNEVDKNG